MNTDSLVKAIALAGFASANLAKSHVKEHERHSASGAVSQVRAYDDKRKSSQEASVNADRASRHAFSGDAPSKEIRGAAGQHHHAAFSHVEAANMATDNSDISNHLHAASRHLGAIASLHNYARDGKLVQNSNSATIAADNLTSHAYNASHKKLDNSQDLNRASGMHLLAMEQHQRAEHHAKELANDGPEHMADAAVTHAQHHRKMALEHGAEVQRITRISTKARDEAYSASAKANKSGSKDDHEKASRLHSIAAHLDYDSEGEADHKVKAKEHQAKADASLGKDIAKQEGQTGSPEYQSARKSADALSTKANRTGQIGHHKDAESAHEEAGMMAEDEGLEKEHEYHGTKVNQHRHQARR
jgi:hypothetical protein